MILLFAWSHFFRSKSGDVLCVSIDMRIISRSVILPAVRNVDRTAIRVTNFSSFRDARRASALLCTPSATVLCVIVWPQTPPCRLDADQIHRDCAESARQFSSQPPTATPEAHGLRFFRRLRKTARQPRHEHRRIQKAAHETRTDGRGARPAMPARCTARRDRSGRHRPTWRQRPEV